MAGQREHMAGGTPMVQEHLEGNMRFHDVLRDEYLFNGVLIRTSTKEVRITVTSGADGDGGEPLLSTDRGTIVFVWNVIQELRRQQYRQTPPRSVPKPASAETAFLEKCSYCGGEGFVHVWDALAECAVCKGTG